MTIPVLISKEDLRGVISEVVSTLYIVGELAYIDEEEVDELVDELTYNAWAGLDKENGL